MSSATIVIDVLRVNYDFYIYPKNTYPAVLDTSAGSQMTLLKILGQTW